MHYFLFVLLMVISITSSVHCNDKSENGSENSLGLDTLNLLTAKDKKFWDVEKGYDKVSNHTGELLNWMISYDKTLVEYSYSKNNRIKHRYGGDVMLDQLKFNLNNDTLFIDDVINVKYLIRKITVDSLVIQRVDKNLLQKAIIFKKSYDQKTLPEF